jgi:eukaryotic-like serine/threonine-protein kinase
MPSNLWQQAKQALSEALSLDRQARADFLQQLENQSPELAAEVRTLIAAGEAAEEENFLELPANRVELEDTVAFNNQVSFSTFATLPPTAGKAPNLQPPLPDGPINTSALVTEDYEIEELIGQGGMGVVYKAYQHSLRRHVALKIIPDRLLRTPEEVARFQIEAESAAMLDHPGIVPVYEVGEHYGTHFYSMALVDGKNLAAYVGDESARLDHDKAAEIIEQVCHAVQYAHDRAVIHRDLKPENILLDNEGRPRLTDFGLAKVLKDDEGLTMTGQVMGTPRYMAPEQATGNQSELSNRTDVYSLGATLYALLAGRPPFAADTILQTIKQVVEIPPPSLAQYAPNVGPDLQTICEKCLAKRPRDRYASAGEVAVDLRRYLDGYSIAARPLGRWTRGYLWCRRNPAVAAMIAFATTTLVIATVVSSIFAYRTSQAYKNLDANARQLREAIKDSFVFASENDLAQEPGMQAARETLLKTALQYYSELAKQTPEDSTSQQEMAEAQFMLGKVEAALGHTKSARVSYENARGVQQRLAEKVPNDTSILADLAKTHTELANVARHQWTQQSIIDTQQTEPAEGDNELFEQWIAQVTRALEIRQELVDLQPAHHESLRLLANATMNLAIAKGERGFAHGQIDQVAATRKLMLHAQEIRQQAIKQPDAKPEVLRDYAQGYINLANLGTRIAAMTTPEQKVREHLLQSRADARQAVDAYHSLAPSARNFDTQLQLSSCYRLMANTEFQLSLLEEAKSSYQRSQEIIENLSARNPHVLHYRLRLAETYYNLCNLCFFQKQTNMALKHLADCRECLLDGIRINPRDDQAAQELAASVRAIALALAEEKSFQIALDQLDQTIAPLEALIEQSPEYSSLARQVEDLQKTAERIRSDQRKSEESPVA